MLLLHKELTVHTCIQYIYNTNYIYTCTCIYVLQHITGEYKEDHSSIKMFWNVVNNFSENEKRQLLKFVTSCSRPPMLGFKELHPPFTILSARESSHLPSASTCMHLLKLPMFETVELMKEKLLYAISSGAGFELS